MDSKASERLTTINRQEKAALIWAIADKLVGVYKPHEYGNVILPMCVIKRFEDTLAPTRDAVWKKNEELGEMDLVLKARSSSEPQVSNSIIPASLLSKIFWLILITSLPISTTTSSISQRM